jgi:hypothetical protein
LIDGCRSEGHIVRPEHGRLVQRERTWRHGQDVDKRWIQSRSQYQNKAFELYRVTEPKTLKHGRPADCEEEGFHVWLREMLLALQLPQRLVCLCCFPKSVRPTTPSESQRSDPPSVPINTKRAAIHAIRGAAKVATVQERMSEMMVRRADIPMVLRTGGIDLEWFMCWDFVSEIVEPHHILNFPAPLPLSVTHIMGGWWRLGWF